MKEVFGNLWTYPADLRVITTNGFVRKDGRAVMGRGCAKEATRYIPDVENKLGKLLREHGNRPFRVGKYGNVDVATFPVKHNWWEYADLELIEGSAKRLVELVDEFGYQNAVVARPGSGNGGLEYQQVKNVIEPHFDNRFSVIGFEGER